ncbi:MAG: hypothetical protein K1X31_11065 [Gemmatimonadaceae bacterium]|nr:hypothetical protein [Gemmatimonadaceae bacterium]
MWSILKELIVRGILAKTILRSFGWLTWLLPLGFLLKLIGWPLLAVLGTLAVPVLLLLLLVGLPIFVVLLVGGALLALVGTVLSVGLALAKVILPVALIVWLLGRLWRRDAAATPDAPAAAAEGPASA